AAGLRLADLPGPGRPRGGRGRAQVPRPQVRQQLFQRRVRHRHPRRLLRPPPPAPLRRCQAQAAGGVIFQPRPSASEEMKPSLFDAANACLAIREPAEKVRRTHAVAAAFRAGELAMSEEAPAPEPIGVPGRPERPRLVMPREVPQRGLGSVGGRAAFLHAIAHIEFNAINLAWDAVYRFRGMPAAYYVDWVGVADDEARHFMLLDTRLRELGYAYGDFDAHNGLWEMAVKTADSGRKRMALVPRVLE